MKTRNHWLHSTQFFINVIVKQLRPCPSVSLLSVSRSNPMRVVCSPLCTYAWCGLAIHLRLLSVASHELDVHWSAPKNAQVYRVANKSYKIYFIVE